MAADVQEKKPPASSQKTDDTDFPVLNVDPTDVGLKVTPNAWKWPVAWPYGGDYFDREDTSPDGEFFSATPYMEKALDPAAEQALQEHFGRVIAPASRVLELGMLDMTMSHVTHYSGSCHQAKRELQSR